MKKGELRLDVAFQYGEPQRKKYMVLGECAGVKISIEGAFFLSVVELSY